MKWIACSVLVALTCCAAPLDGDGVFAVPGSYPERPRLRFADGQVSLNDTCMIRLSNKLNPKIPPMYVNGQPLGFC